MGIKTGITKEVGVTPKAILVAPEEAISMSVFCNNTGVAAKDGKKVIKVGTPLAGDLENRNTAFKVATGADAVGIAISEMDVTNAEANGTILVDGVVNMAKLDADVAALITEEVKTALAGKITFVK